ncbi:MAG: cytochrome c peroxidase [Thiohalocapsa sp.]
MRQHLHPAAPELSIAGDYKGGYVSADYRTRSKSVTRRLGEPADLVGLAQSPQLGLPPVPVPSDNPLTPERVALGRKLFFDRRLSLNDTCSCAMCHIPAQGFTSNEMATAVGFEGRSVRRNSPSLYNVAYLRRLFHDGREDTLEQQIWGPLLASNEMANPSVGSVLKKLRQMSDYAGRFEAVFDGRGPEMETLGQALAAYQRTLVSADSPFHRWHFGGDEDALDASAKRGFELFTGKAGCVSCHSIDSDQALFTDHKLYNTGIGHQSSMGIRPPKKRVTLAPGVFVDVDRDIIDKVGAPPPADLGLYEITQDPNDRWKYRTPSSRNVALSAPYMHDGSIGSLEEVVRFYDRGGVPNPLLDPRVKALGLNQTEADDLVAFLRALTGSNVDLLVSDAFAAPVGDITDADPNWAHDNRLDY